MDGKIQDETQGTRICHGLELSMPVWSKDTKAGGGSLGMSERRIPHSGFLGKVARLKLSWQDKGSRVHCVSLEGGYVSSVRTCVVQFGMRDQLSLQP